MSGLISWIRHAVLFASLASLVASQQRPPEAPFQAVHMLTVRQADEEKKLLAAMDDLNSAISKGGCPACIYHLWKLYGDQAGPFNYLWVSNWPGRAIYEKVHLTTEYVAATQRHPEIQAIIGGQIYNRYVEVKPGN
jgi:hypothetical protein